jgi:A/G-specific adenine glycosylase
LRITPHEAKPIAAPTLPKLRAALLAWYARHRRELPWRRDREAYRVWVSEIMLQQTRVAAVLEHYRTFLEAFPTVQALALAPEERVLALWSGLGYYRRVRMLHQAARLVANQLGGVIPHSAEELKKLPGVGRYTAAAIASIAFGEPVAVVDGNVERVLSRFLGEPGSPWQQAQQLLDPRHPGDWNQAMMELGAIVCVPQSPHCPECPWLAWCCAHATGPGMPHEASRLKAPRRRVRQFRALIERKNCVYLVQRAADESKMAGMWELPELAPEDTDRIAVPPDAEQLYVVRHSITDTDYEVRVVRLLPDTATRNPQGRWVQRQLLAELPLTGLTRKILCKHGLLPTQLRRTQQGSVQ